MKLPERTNKIALSFILLSLLCLLAGALFGCIAALQFVYPGFASFLPFISNRPLHVSLILAWIFLSSIGGIYYYLPAYGGGLWRATAMQRVQFGLTIIAGICIIGSYLFGQFGGREYWEYPPVFSLIIVLAWIIFAVNFFLAIKHLQGKWPAYIWMWATGIVFFFIAFSESNLWLIAAIRNDPIRDITVQWKAYGSLIGSWNMLVYGTGLYLMQRISGNANLAWSKSAFLLYFLGLANLLFGWAHHIYIVPINAWIQGIAYAVSMSEWIVFFRIIYFWQGTVSTARQHLWLSSFRFLLTADAWIFLNIFLALLISIPAINRYTHGTHITVAHAMGSTIGINTMILLASCYFIAHDTAGEPHEASPRRVELGGWLILNASLVLFLLMLLVAGVRKGALLAQGVSFAGAMADVAPYLKTFAFTGLGIFLGLTLIVIPLSVRLAQRIRGTLTS